MPNLNKRQKEFRKQMQQLQQVKSYKEIIDEHNDFYNNKAYENELFKKNEKRKRNKNKIISLCIISILIFTGYKNIELIKNKIIKLIPEKSQGQTIKLYNDYFYTDNEIKQYQIGIYSKNYGESIKLLNLKQEQLINENISIENININEIENQIIILNDLLINFKKYQPEEINSELHNINISILENLKSLYQNILLYKNDLKNMNYYKSYASSVINLNTSRQKYREKLLEIFNNINMNYTITENNTINFTYKEIEHN